MEVFGRSPYFPQTPREWLLFAAVGLLIAISGTRAASRSAAVFMLLAAFAAYLFDSAIYIPIGIAMAGVAAWAFRGHTDHVQPLRRTLREAAICTSVFVLYETGRHLVVGSWPNARANSEAILDFERTFRIHFEPNLQHFLLNHEDLMHLTNSAYSWFFLPIVAASLFWLFIAEDGVYRRYRASLAVSAAVAVLLILAFPVAPPRLTPGSEVIGTQALVGGSHSFVNPFAAVPSLHVGWVALGGVALFAGVRHWMRWFWLCVPVATMAFTVMSTGHHYLVDGLIGATISVAPFVAMTIHDARWENSRARTVMVNQQLEFGGRFSLASQQISEVPRLRFTVFSLSALLTYLIVRQIVDHGFTHYWGYMVAQIAATIVIIIWLSVKFAPQGGLSILTHVIIVITTYADTLGTAGHMYDRYISYDKITHFLGSAAVASACGDVLLALNQRGTLSWSPVRILATAAVISIGMGIGWEIYEYLGDKLLSTGRHAGAVDTYYDLVSDSVGAITAVALLYWWHFMPVHSESRSQRAYVGDRSRDNE